MDTSYLLYTSEQNFEVVRFHICTWEFSNKNALVEFGCEIRASNLMKKKEDTIEMYIPWMDKESVITDFYSKLVETSNSRFIFNDSITSSASFDGGENKTGIIHVFSGQNNLCILPVTFKSDFINKKLLINISLESYQNHFHHTDQERPNVYFRFGVTLKKTQLAKIKKGLAKSTILYDIKLNQPRNIPDDLAAELSRKHLCDVKNCFCLNIIPNTHDLIFFDNASLKSVRTLEYSSFKKYLGNQFHIEEDLIVVFNKKSNLDSYSFFSIYAKELIGIDQIVVALLINLLAGILLFKASFDITVKEDSVTGTAHPLPWSFWLVVVLILVMLVYFLKIYFDISFKRKTAK